MSEVADTGDKIPENTIEQESEKTVDIDSPILASDNSIPKQETENMEIHADHLHHAPGKKAWHYLFEFIMLFLAVFAGRVEIVL